MTCQLRVLGYRGRGSGFAGLRPEVRRLTALVFAQQRLARCVPYRVRSLEALRTRRKGYTIRLRNSPGRCHGTIQQLPERLRDAMTTPSAQLSRCRRSTYNFHALGQSKKKESLGPKTKIMPFQ